MQGLIHMVPCVLFMLQMYNYSPPISKEENGKGVGSRRSASNSHWKTLEVELEV